jgi:hypothetical protein
MTSIDDLLQQAQDKTNGELDYVNQVRVHVSDTEVTFDFYRVMPHVLPASPPHVERIRRVVLPLSVAKQMGTLLTTQTEEQTNGIASLFGVWRDVPEDWFDALREGDTQRLDDLWR